MGKVRIKTIGLEETEEKQKKAAQKRKEAKKEKKLAKGAHGGERVVSMAPSEEELERLSVIGSQLSDSGQPVDQSTSKLITGKQVTEDRKQKTDNRKRRLRGRHYKDKLMLIDRKKVYPLPEALELLRKVGYTKFNGTVELHINTVEKGINGQVALPHGTGKKTRMAIADDKLLEEIEKGKIDFDILLATPAMMPKLAKVAKILGPRGLMPNPKAGTISEEPGKLAEKFKAGQMRFKTEGQAPIIHLSVGKLSMKDQELAENIQAVLAAIGPEKIKNVSLKSTMSPGIKIGFN